MWKKLGRTSATALAVFTLSASLTALAPPAGATTGPVLGAAGTSLTINGVASQLTGVDAYELATLWGTNAGCGGMLNDTQLSTFFSSLPTDTLVRIDAFQGSMAINIHTGTLDWTALDRVFAVAAANHDLLIPVLSNEWGSCDDGQVKSLSWFQGGYQQITPASLSQAKGLPAPVLSYQDWVAAVVARYANSPALGMWEPVGEPEADTCVGGPVSAFYKCNGGAGSTCSEATAASALRSFFDAVGSEIRSYDSAHLIEDGMLSGGQCGTQGSDWSYVNASSGIDVTAFHNYYNTSGSSAQAQLPGGDQWNGVALRLNQSAALGKPIINGENGIYGGGGACLTNDQRASVVATTASNEFSAPSVWGTATGISAFMEWDFVPPVAGQPTSYYQCRYDVLQSDPMLATLASLAVVPNP